ncbi:MAG: outer membrane beta-barrel protein [Flavobacteriaceae bacterium]|nr:outer membrane beta-barrel protein [Flavobacteriaceae bacterium]
MKANNFILLVVFCIGFVTINYAQRKNYNIKNGFAIGGGLTQFDIITDNFETKSDTGWLLHMSATVDIPHKWYNVSYGMQLSENKMSVNGLASALSTNFEPIDYKILTAQVAFLMHVKLAGPYLTLDFGPVLQYNSDLEFDDEGQEEWFVAEFDSLLAKDFVDITNFNVNGAVGLTAGFKNFKVRGQYIYGFTNILGDLNNSNAVNFTNKKFKGNQSMLTVALLITF